ncbi:acyltransferase family protein [Pseudoalteromonas sp. YIC-656]|uniref:acyltransferase family protein n=1 Tax=Pseudoalteromonas pernae TaxID=3118054 RepID=UPI0032426A75
MSKAVSRRADIDLLRAAAVLSVILFHFDVPGLQGGFLGVDVFFVISGYLITTHLKEQITDNSFTFIGFYGRRVKRLMPALLFTLLLTSLVALWVLPSTLLSDFSESLITTSVYVSNIYFYSQTGYFDTASHLKPLLHTWSLSVEEQFYLVWPLLTLVAIKFCRLRLVVGLCFVLSLLAAELLYVPGQSFTFFMFPFRIFEFAVGALLCGLTLSSLNPLKRSLISAVGWALIVLSIALLDEQNRMPGLLSLPVCIGTALIILSAQSYNKLPLQAFWLRIGLTSYSLYLLHWPLMVFYKIMFQPALDWLDISILLVITLIGAEFMYRYVENRKWLENLSFKSFSPFYWPMSLVVFASLFYVVSPELHKHLLSNPVQKLLSSTPTYRETKNKLDYLEVEFDLREHEQTIVIVGDSHSKNLAMAIGPLISHRVLIQNDMCDPLSAESLKGVELKEHYKFHTNKEVRNTDCSEFHKSFIERLKSASPDFVIFSERWQRAALPYLAETLAEIRREVTPHIMLLGPNIELVNLPLVALKGVDSVSDINEVIRSRLLDLSDVEYSVSRIAKEQGVHFLSKAEAVCPGFQCQFFDDEMLFYSDTNHWSEAGLKVFGERLVTNARFQAFISKSEPPAGSYDSWYGNYEETIDLTMFADVRQLFQHSQKAQRFNGQSSVLVIGDSSVTEFVSALYLSKSKQGESITPLISACPPVLLDLPSKLRENILRDKKRTSTDCTKHTEIFKRELKKGHIKQVIIAYNWPLYLMEELPKTLIELKSTYHADITLVGMKPRLLRTDTGEPKVQLLHNINRKLDEVSAKSGVQFVDMKSLFCASEEPVTCAKEMKPLYTAPNSLSLAGVKYSSEHLSILVEKNYE